MVLIFTVRSVRAGGPAAPAPVEPVFSVRLRSLRSSVCDPVPSARPAQNLSFTASCICRSVVPHVAHDGLASIAEIVPNAALPNWPFGFANCGWFSRLKISSRSSDDHRPILVFLITDMSTLNWPGPRTVLRPVSPKVPVVSGTCWKHAVLNHRSMVGLLGTGSQIVFGRLLVMPVDSMVCDWVIVIRQPRA